MKRIYNKLKKLFPDIYVIIRYEINIYKEEYSVYINDNESIWKHNWSDTFSTLEDLENHLKEHIENYK